ncbi:hypothetical protein [Haloplanus natans]|uniref:hypothetical protein n=1 Tax=Haloplanus natans TaxID=376171 RepID=UPI000677CB2A|nr:hypothetical protein [Haloplanus natans]
MSDATGESHEAGAVSLRRRMFVAGAGAVVGAMGLHAVAAALGNEKGQGEHGATTGGPKTATDTPTPPPR